MFNFHLLKLKKYGYCIKKDKLLLDYRYYERPLYWDRIKNHFVNTPITDGYNLGLWRYTNDVITYSDLYITKEECEKLLKTIAINQFK